MVTVARRAAVLGAVLWAFCLCAPLADASPILVGPEVDSGGEVITFSYNPSTPYVQIGALGAGVEVTFRSTAGPVISVFELQGAARFYHHLHLVEYWAVTGPAIQDWFETIMIPDGEGGWKPSPNGDDLWYSCRGGVTPVPVVTPVPTATAVLGNPTDTCAFYWSAGVPAGTEVRIDKWVTVPATVSTFALYQYAATPEPATMGLLGVGLGALLTVGRRRHRR